MTTAAPAHHALNSAANAGQSLATRLANHLTSDAHSHLQHLDMSSGHKVLAGVIGLGVLACAPRGRHLELFRILAAAVAGVGFLLNPIVGAIGLAVAVGYLAGRSTSGKVHGFQATVATLIAGGLEVGLYAWARPHWWHQVTHKTSTLLPAALGVLVATLVVSVLIRKLALGGSGKGGVSREARKRLAHGGDALMPGTSETSGSVPEEQRDPIRDASKVPGLTEQVLQDHNFVCAVPGCGVVEGAPMGPGEHAPKVKLEMDHKHPWARGGRTVRENLQPLCGPHNREKSDKTMAEYLTWRSVRGLD